MQLCRWLSIALVLPLACGMEPNSPSRLPKPADFSPTRLAINGEWRDISNDLWSIGPLAAGEEVTVRMFALQLSDVYFLADDGTIVGAAGRTRKAAFFVREPDSYYILLVPSGGSLDGTISVNRRRLDTAPDTQGPQVFVLDFDGTDVATPPCPDECVPCEEYHCGLKAFDLSAMASQTDDENRDFLSGIQPLVTELVAERLRDIFSDFNVEIRMVPPEQHAQAYSTVFFTNEEGSGCKGNSFETVGENIVLYGVAAQDLGNSRRDDNAFVFFGSFIGPDGNQGIETSVGDLVNIIAHAAAHEMGHLLGLQHVRRLSDIMWGHPTTAFTRKIFLGRGQVVLGSGGFGLASDAAGSPTHGECQPPENSVNGNDKLFTRQQQTGTESGSTLLSFLFQDPERYLESILGPRAVDGTNRSMASPAQGVGLSAP